MSYPVLAGISLLLLLLDVTLGGLLTVWNVRPSLTLPFVIYLGLQQGPIEGVLFGAGLGLGEDIFGTLPLGATMLSYTVVGFFSGKLWDGGPFRVLWPWSVFLLIGAIISEMILHYFVPQGARSEFFTIFLRSGIPTALYTTAVGLLWYLSPLHRLKST
jgi:rod shape-determining protein MreD